VPPRPTVAAIVPVRAPAPYLQEALDAVLAEAPDEVVVVDDGSPEPLRLARRHADACALVRRERPGGPAAARDAALAASSAELLAFADADDVWQAGKLAAQRDALAAHPGAAVCFGRAEVIGPDGRPTGERFEELAPGVHEPDALAPILFDRNPIPASTAVVRRSAVEAAGGFRGPAALASDWDLWLRLVEAGARFVCEPRAVTAYRRHPGGVTADVAALARASRAIHAAHASLVDEQTRRRVEARDLRALARGEIRRRRYRAARAALRDAARIEPPGMADRLLALALAIPGARSLLGRRNPYR
jgi:glycosyltransferase involved in cell wall biosynthesis